MDLITAQINVIYILSRKGLDGLLKVGMTRIDVPQFVRYAPNAPELIQKVKERYSGDAVTLAINFDILHAELAIDSDGLRTFTDKEVHHVLERSGYKNAPINNGIGIAQEWFEVDLDHAIAAIQALKEGREKIDGPVKEKPKSIEIHFRDEQKAAIAQTLSHFKIADRMLWNAKMRFGKTLCTLQVILDMDVERVLILTHRPTVRSGWFEDFRLLSGHKNHAHFHYGSKNGKDTNQCDEGDCVGKDFKTLTKDLETDNTHFIYFASIQDLRGKDSEPTEEEVEALEKEWKKSNREIFSTQWDLVIIDEAHEGTQTPLGKAVINELQRGNQPKMLYLSGTPFNILDQFSSEEIYTWDYVMEQDAKERWSKEHPDERNPYEGLAQLKIFAYNLGEEFGRQHPEYTKSDEDFFNFAEFFRVFTGKEDEDGIDMPQTAKVGDFVHEDDIVAFLDLLCKEDEKNNYPFSTPTFRDALLHTLWMVPSVKAAKRLAELINAHRLHTEFGLQVVNVAGQEDKIAPTDDANAPKKKQDPLQRVKSAIADCDGSDPLKRGTITLSCGRLTTGVSVPEWTGVFMLSGGEKTSAAGYMQTIFRGQTPFKNGMIKRECYAFDFAPDRTITVVDDFIKISYRASSNASRQSFKNSSSATYTETCLKFLPIIAIDGGEERPYSAKQFIQDVNRAYADHVIRQGFKSRKLFQNLLGFTEDDHNLLNEIGNVIGNGGSLAGNGSVDISHNNLTGENAPTLKSGKGNGGNSGKSGKKPKKKNEDQIKHSVAVLELIMVRLPLLLFGAVDDAEKLSLDNLTADEFIDQESWNEFMPRGFSKESFQKIQHLLRLDVLIAATQKLIQETRKIDELPIEQRTAEMARKLTVFRFPDKETVLTPWRVVNMHLADTIGGYDFYDEAHRCELPSPRFVSHEGVTDDVFGTPDAKVLEINSKSGVYPLWLTYTFWRRRKEQTYGQAETTPEQEWQLWADVLRDNLFVVCKTRMAQKITRRVLAGYRDAVPTNLATIDGLATLLKDPKQHDDIVKKILNPKTYSNNIKSKTMLNFNAVVGNPPYQETGHGQKPLPIYQLFINVARELSPQFISMISPSRWFSSNDLKDFRESLIQEDKIDIIHDFTDARDCFSGVDIKGGISFFRWNRNSEGGCSYYNHNGNETMFAHRNWKLEGTDVMVRDCATIDILVKVREKASEFFDSLISSNDPFGFDKREDHSSKRLKINFEKVPFDDSVPFYYNGWRKEGIGYVKRTDVSKNSEWLDKIKILIPKAWGTGVTSKDRLKAFIVEGASCCTETYLVIGPFDDLGVSKNVKTYTETKFFHFMVSIMKNTQNAMKGIYCNVPLQDFTSASDIDWGKSISEIDQQLYKKYGLTGEEVSFIEKMIKGME